MGLSRRIDQARTPRATLSQADRYGSVRWSDLLPEYNVFMPGADESRKFVATVNRLDGDRSR